MPKAFSISFQSGVRGRGREPSRDMSWAGYAGNLFTSSGSRKTDFRVGGLPRCAESFICDAVVAHIRKSIAGSTFLASRGIAISQLPISACPDFFAPGIWPNSIWPITLDLFGSLKELIHAGQLMDI